MFNILSHLFKIKNTTPQKIKNVNRILKNDKLENLEKNTAISLPLIKPEPRKLPITANNTTIIK